MTLAVLLVAVCVVLLFICLSVVFIVAFTVKALAEAEPVIKIVQEYNVVESGINDIYNEDGEIENDDVKLPTMDEVLAHVNKLFTDEDEVKSDG